jgi:hypothetical protein
VADRASLAAVDSSSWPRVWPKIESHSQAIGPRSVRDPRPVIGPPRTAMRCSACGRRQDEPQVQVAADSVVEVGHQVLDLATIEPPQLGQLPRTRRPHRRRRHGRAGQIHHVPTRDRMVPAADLMLHPHLEARLFETLARCGLRHRLPRLHLAAGAHPRRHTVASTPDQPPPPARSPPPAPPSAPAPTADHGDPQTGHRRWERLPHGPLSPTRRGYCPLASPRGPVLAQLVHGRRTAVADERVGHCCA